jgi:hypothetical protein
MHAGITECLARSIKIGGTGSRSAWASKVIIFPLTNPNISLRGIPASGLHLVALEGFLDLPEVAILDGPNRIFVALVLTFPGSLEQP